jgi:hypothetical protein
MDTVKCCQIDKMIIYRQFSQVPSVRLVYWKFELCQCYHSLNVISNHNRWCLWVWKPDDNICLVEYLDFELQGCLKFNVPLETSEKYMIWNFYSISTFLKTWLWKGLLIRNLFFFIAFKFKEKEKHDKLGPSMPWLVLA